MSHVIGPRWWEDPLSVDIHMVLKSKEKSIQTYFGLSRHIAARRVLVDWLAIIREKLCLQEVTYHLAVHLLDYFMEEQNNLEYGQLHLVALCCLTIAAKMEENYANVPDTNVLNSFIPKPLKAGLSAFFCRSAYMNMELDVLKHFQWNIMKPTIAHFLPYYSSRSVCLGDLYDGIPVNSLLHLKTHVENYTGYFQDVSLQYTQFRNYPPSKVAAACLASTRISVHLTPTWPDRLSVLTGFCIEEILPCVHLLLSIHDVDVNKENVACPEF